MDKEESVDSFDVMQNLFDLQTNSDIIFYSTTSDKKLTGHSFVLKVRCPKLLENVVKEQEGVLYVEYLGEFSFLSTILEYCYTNYLCFEDFTLPQIASLYLEFEKLELLHALDLCKYYVLVTLPERDFVNVHRLLRITLYEVRNLQLFKLLKWAAIKYLTDFIRDPKEF